MSRDESKFIHLSLFILVDCFKIIDITNTNLGMKTSIELEEEKRAS